MLKTKRTYFLVFLLFLFVFQPPFFPFSLIYLLGPIIFVYNLNKRGPEIREIINRSHIKSLSLIIVSMTGYLILVNLIDLIAFPEKELMATRLKCFNQLFFLTFFQFGFVLFYLYKANKRNLSLDDVFYLLLQVAVIQGICALLAFAIPPIRQLFVTFGDKDLFSNEYFLERRGYGFSMTLIDTFGYGMGLIAGYILLFKWKPGMKRYLIIALGLILFTIAVNARTGIIVFLIALGVKVTYGKSLKQLLLKVIPAIVFSYLILIYVPHLLQVGVQSDNVTIRWISSSFADIFDLISGTGESVDSVEELGFLSAFVKLPSNDFEYLFGSGHYVYDTHKTLGFRTDIGYFNMLWEFGLIGTIILLGVMFIFMMRPFTMTNDVSIKRITLFNTVSYFLLLMKAILIGFNPGVFINYLVTFSIYYYIWKEKQKRVKFKFKKNE